MLNTIQIPPFKSDSILDTPFYTEGPVIDSMGNIFVTNLLGGQILKIDAQHHIEEWGSCKSPNGQFIAPNGNHFVCNSLAGSVACFNPKGEYLKTWFEGKVGNHFVQSPNDLWIQPDNSLFFTDSIRHDGVVVFIDKQRSAHLIAEGLDYPNGIVYDVQKKCLYVAESFKNRILCIDLRGPMPLLQVLVNLPQNPSGNEPDNLPDGLALDENGNLWIAHHGMGLVHQYNFQENQLYSMQSGIPLSSNVYVDRQNIIITGGLKEPGPGIIRIIKR